MTRPKSARSAGSLVRKLSGNSLLPSYIKQLPAPTLVKLIEDIGLEDSQEIIALAGPEQLRAVLSISLWSGSRPGRAEVLNLDQFVRWVECWLQEGESTLVKRVLDLGADFVVMCLRKLLVAVDRTVVGLEESGVEIGPYVIFPRQEKHWHSIVEALAGLWHREPDFVLHMLRRCSFERSILSEDAAEHGADDSLYQDIAAERAMERADVGYVNPVDASLFLMTAKTAQLHELCGQQAYDVNTAGYLDKQQRQLVNRSTRKATESEERSSAPARLSRENPIDASEVERRVAQEADAASTPEDFEALDSLLRDAGILESTNAGALLADQRSSPPRTSLLESALASLAQTAPDVVSRRMGELAYLSNVLISGAEIQGRGFTQAESAKVALATANLGATYLLGARADAAMEMDRAHLLLEHDPGVVRLFQIGFNLLTTIPARCCAAVYRAKAVQARRPGHVVIMEMDEVLGSSKLTDLVNEGLYGEAKSLIDGLSAAMDSAACVALRILIDSTPCFPRVLDDHTGSASIYVDKGHRYIGTVEDLERIMTFLEDLPDYCGN